MERLCPLPLMKRKSWVCGGGEGRGQKLAVQKCGKHFRQSWSWRDFFIASDETRKWSVGRGCRGQKLVMKNVANTLSNPAVEKTLFIASDETRKLEWGPGAKACRRKMWHTLRRNYEVEQIFHMLRMKRERVGPGQGQKLKRSKAWRGKMWQTI